MSDTPLKDATRRLDGLPPGEVQAGAAADATDAGVFVDGAVDVGKPGGWSVAFSASYWREKKGQALALLRWRK